MFLKNKNKNSFFYLTLILLVMNVGLIFYLKYKNQNLSLSEFELMFPGNLLNIFVALFPIFLLSILKIRSASFEKKYRTLFFLLSLFSFLLPLISVALNFLNVIPETPYLLSQPLTKVIEGTLFSLSYLSLMFAASIAWLGIFRGDNLVLLRALSHTTIYGLFLLLFSFVYLSIFTNSAKQFLGEGKSKLAVVLGAAVWSGDRASDIHKSRLRKAAQLYFNKQASKILLTGGNAPGEKSEAMIGYKYLAELGVPAKDLLMEEKTSSTTEQISFIKNSIINRGKFREVVVVSNNFHLPRINEIRKFYKINFKLAGAEIKLSHTKQIYYKLREGIALHFFWLFGI